MILYLAPVDQMHVATAEPRPARRGLFAWGLPSLAPGQHALKIVELITLFVVMPGVAVSFAGALVLPLVMNVVLVWTVILLSFTRNFHWRDLLPMDFWSEWRLLVGGSVGFAAVVLALTAVFWPQRLFSAPPEVVAMLIGFPLLTALPIELVYRALFYRRYGRLFSSPGLSIVFGGVATGIAYAVLSHAFSGAVFGFFLGMALGAVYLRTGMFLLCILLHWAAVAALYLIGPGIF